MSRGRTGSLLEAVMPDLSLDERRTESPEIVIYDPLFRSASGPVPTGGPRYFRTTLLPRLRQEFELYAISDSALHHITGVDFKLPFLQLLKRVMNHKVVVIPTSEDPRVAWPAQLSAILSRGRVLLPVMHCIPPPKYRLGPKGRNILAFCNQRFLIVISNLLTFPLLTINDHTGQHLRLIAPRSTTLVLRPQVQSPRHFVKREDHGDRELQIVCIGRQSEHKGSLELPEIAEALVRHGVRFRLHIVGDEPARISTASRRRASKLGVDHLIVRHGRVTESAKVGLLTRSQVLVNPSHEEGYSYVVEEAVGMGIPAIVWDIPEMESVWRGNPLVSLAPSYDVDLFAYNLVQAVRANSPNLRL